MPRAAAGGRGRGRGRRRGRPRKAPKIENDESDTEKQLENGSSSDEVEASPPKKSIAPKLALVKSVAGGPANAKNLDEVDMEVKIVTKKSKDAVATPRQTVEESTEDVATEAALKLAVNARAAKSAIQDSYELGDLEVARQATKQPVAKKSEQKAGMVAKDRPNSERDTLGGVSKGIEGTATPPAHPKSILKSKSSTQPMSGFKIPKVKMIDVPWVGAPKTESQSESHHFTNELEEDDDHRGRVDELAERLHQVVKERDDVFKRLAAVEAQVRFLEERHRSQTDEQLELEAKLKEANAEIQNLRQKHNSDITTWVNDMKSILDGDVKGIVEKVHKAMDKMHTALLPVGAFQPSLGRSYGGKPPTQDVKADFVANQAADRRPIFPTPPSFDARMSSVPLGRDDTPSRQSSASSYGYHSQAFTSGRGGYVPRRPYGGSVRGQPFIRGGIGSSNRAGYAATPQYDGDQHYRQNEFGMGGETPKRPRITFVNDTYTDRDAAGD